MTFQNYGETKISHDISKQSLKYYKIQKKEPRSTLYKAHLNIPLVLLNNTMWP